jgi:hypothetical protein
MKRNARIKFFPIGILLLATFLLLSSRADAQFIPDSIFDKPPEAFGNTIQDVPPDISGVEIDPVSPQPGEPVRIMANVKVDSDISRFYVNDVFLYYKEAGQQTVLKRVRMERMTDRHDWWSAELPGFPAGSEIEFYVRGIDKIGNEVIQLPAYDKPSYSQMLDVLYDGEDKDVPAGMDILSVRIGYTGKELLVCPKMRRRFQQFSELGAAAVVVGFIADDVRAHPACSVTENTAGFMGYIPAMDLKGILNIEQITRATHERENESTAEILGRYVCLGTLVEKLTPTPDRGLKIFAATGGINMLTTELHLGDATPYAIVYFNGNKFKVGAGVP